MADDEVPEGTADNPADADADADGGDGGKEQLTPYRATKMAGIVVGTVLLCAAVVVAAVWVISEVVDEDDDESWFEYVPSSALAAVYDDQEDDVDEYRRGYGKDRSADDDRWKWHDKEYFAKPDSWGESWRSDDGCRMPFGIGAHTGPIVVLVVPGLGLGGWGTDGGFGLGGLGGGPQGLPPDLAPFSEREGWFGTEQWPGEWGFEGFFGGFAPEAPGEGYFLDPADLLEDLFEGANHQAPELLGDLGLEVTELDNTGNGEPQASESLVPT